MEGEGSSAGTASWRAVRVVLGALLSLVGALTLGNAPTVFFGYGLSAFAVLALAYALPRGEAIVAFLVGMVVGVALDLHAPSLFTFVGVGAVPVRLLQLALLLWLKPQRGFLGPALLAIVVGAVLAILVGIVSYGASGIMPAYAVWDVIYLVPAYLLYRIVSSKMPWSVRGLGTIVVVSGTVGAFFAASAFFLAAPFVLSLAYLFYGFLVVRGARAPGGITAKPAVMAVLSIAVLVALVVAFVASGPAAGYAARASLYPLYPDSLGVSQWMQTSAAAGCRAGNLAGAGTQANGVWGPERLRVMNTCVTVTGTIVGLEPTSGPAVDGDYGIDLQVDPGSAWTLSLENYVLESGHLHIEVVPSDQAAVLGELSLAPGQHIQVTGVWVLDTDHGWGSEIHPAWSVAVVPP